jgi:hypothetical protein
MMIVAMNLTYIMHVLKVFHELIKFVQNHNAFVYDFVGVVKLCCANLYWFYYDSKKSCIDL